MKTEQINRVIVELTHTINNLKEVRKAIGSIETDDDYMWLELAYMITNYRRNLEGFIQWKIQKEGEQSHVL